MRNRPLSFWSPQANGGCHRVSQRARINTGDAYIMASDSAVQYGGLIGSLGHARSAASACYVIYSEVYGYNTTTAFVRQSRGRGESRVGAQRKKVRLIEEHNPSWRDTRRRSSAFRSPRPLFPGHSEGGWPEESLFDKGGWRYSQLRRLRLTAADWFAITNRSGGVRFSTAFSPTSLRYLRAYGK